MIIDFGCALKYEKSKQNRRFDYRHDFFDLGLVYYWLIARIDLDYDLMSQESIDKAIFLNITQRIFYFDEKFSFSAIKYIHGEVEEKGQFPGYQTFRDKYLKRAQGQELDDFDYFYILFGLLQVIELYILH